MTPTNPLEDRDTSRDELHVVDGAVTRTGAVPDTDAVQDQLSRVLSFEGFRRAPALSNMLRYILECSLDTHRETADAYSIAVEALGRRSDFDPQADPIVRVQANRMRKVLAAYYRAEGKSDPILIEIPSGAYQARFSWRTVPARAESGAPRIVVMPFTQMGPGDYGHFRLGVPYQIVDGLIRYESVRVIALESVLDFEERLVSPFVVGHALGADFTMTGEYSVSDSRFQCRCRLLKLDTHRVVWSEQFDGDLSEFDPNDITLSVANRITILTADEFGVIPKLKSIDSMAKKPADVTVYDAILRYYDFSTTLDPTKFAPALAALESATVKAPGNAEAWASLAIMMFDSAVLNIGDIEGFLTRGVKAACHAIRLSPGTTLPRVARIYTLCLEGKVDGMVKECRELLRSNPLHDSRTGHAGFFLAMAGRFDEGLAAIAAVRKATRYAPTWYHFAGFLAAYIRGDAEGALEEASAISMPDLYWHRVGTAASLGRLGRVDEAADELAALLELHPGFERTPRRILRYLLCEASLAEEVLDGLQQAGLADAFEGAE